MNEQVFDCQKIYEVFIQSIDWFDALKKNAVSLVALLLYLCHFVLISDVSIRAQYSIGVRKGD